MNSSHSNSSSKGKVNIPYTESERSKPITGKKEEVKTAMAMALSMANVMESNNIKKDSLEVPEGSRGMVRIKKKGHNRKESMASGSAYRDDGSIDSRMSGLSRKTDAKSALRLFKNHRKS